MSGKAMTIAKVVTAGVGLVAGGAPTSDFNTNKAYVTDSAYRTQADLKRINELEAFQKNLKEVKDKK